MTETALLVLAAVPYLVSIVLRLAAPSVVRCLPPSVSVPLLTAAALASALAGGIGLSAVAVLSLAQLPRIAGLLHVSSRWLGDHAVAPAGAGLLVGLLVAGLLLASAVRLARSGQALLVAARAARRMPGDGELVVVEDAAVAAYAVSGLPGRIVVSRALMQHLAATERRAVLAHEAAHLAGHHQLYIQASELAAVGDPLLRPVAAAVQLGVERWADERAAAELGDRRLVARALARTALLHSGHPTPIAALPMGERAVPVRVRWLLQPAPTMHRRAAGMLAAAVLTCSVVACGTVALAHNEIERAQRGYPPATALR